MHRLSSYLANSGKTPELQALLITIAHCCSEISSMLQTGPIAGITGAAGNQNVQGEEQQQLDVLANDLLMERLSTSGLVSGLASEEEDAVRIIPGGAPHLVLFDPLDGSSNIAINGTVGTIFSILAAPTDSAVGEQHFLQSGRRQLAAGYALYGPASVLVLSLGDGVVSFCFDPSSGSWLRTQAEHRMAPDSTDYAINHSNSRHWEAGVRDVIAQYDAGTEGPLGKNFNMRWVGSMVADVHRLLSKGGVFLYPADTRKPQNPGKLRLMYEANPMGFLVEQAGGIASTGHVRILDLEPTEIHQRVPVILGAAESVKRFETALAAQG